MKPTKLFISHASEDKKSFVEPLVEALKNDGFEVWYDKFSLTIGDSLLQKISQGLKECDYGVVVLSPVFFTKKWGQAELDGLFALETTERKVILPIWKDVRVDDVAAFSPVLAGRLGATTAGGVETVVAEIRRAVEATERVASFSSIENAVSKFRALDNEIFGAIRADELTHSSEGAEMAASAAKELILWLKLQVENLAKSSQSIKIRCASSSERDLRIAGGYAFHFDLVFSSRGPNLLSGATLDARAYQGFADPDLAKRPPNSIWGGVFKPGFDHSGKLLWRSDSTSQEFTSEGLQIHLLEVIVDGIRQLHDVEVAKRAN